MMWVYILVILSVLNAMLLWACCKVSGDCSRDEEWRSHCESCGCRLQCDENCPRRKRQ